MKFKLVKSNCKNVCAYGVENISTGDTVEFTGHFVEKAKNNSDFKLIAGKTKKVQKNGDSGGNKK